MLSVSRTSVREATRVLQTLGYVTLVPGKGAFVADLKPSDGGEENWFDVENVQFYDFMEVRMAIETLAVRLSVERATPKQIRALEKIHAAFLEANEKQDGLQLIMLDEQFHNQSPAHQHQQAASGVLPGLPEQLLHEQRGLSERGGAPLPDSAVLPDP